MIQNHWRNCEFCTPSSTISSSTRFQLCSFSTLTVTSTCGRFNSCVWLLLFKVLREIISLCLVSFGIYCATLSVDRVIVNYLCLFDPEISSINKFSVIKKLFHWLSTTRTPKIVTIGKMVQGVYRSIKKSYALPPR